MTTTKTHTIILTGYEAIEYAEQHGVMPSKYDDPIEGHRSGISIEEAREIARYDPSLIYIELYDVPLKACIHFTALEEVHGLVFINLRWGHPDGDRSINDVLHYLEKVFPGAEDVESFDGTLHSGFISYSKNKVPAGLLDAAKEHRYLQIEQDDWRVIIDEEEVES